MSDYEYSIVLDGITDTSEVPKDKDIYYRCRICGDILPSLPKDNIGCTCGNVFVDIDNWKLFIKDYGKFEVLRRKRRR